MKILLTLLILATPLPAFCSIFTKSIPSIHFEYTRIEKSKHNYLELIYKWSGRLGVPFKIAVSLIQNESNFDQFSFNKNRNKTYDQGLMQLNSSNYKEFKWRFNNNKDFNPYDAETNIRIGLMYLKWIYSNKKIGKKDWYKTIVFWNGSKNSSKRFAKKVLA